jgi:hypothetical protein
MSKVMLFGDSIRMSYQGLVAETLSADGHQVWPTRKLSVQSVHAGLPWRLADPIPGPRRRALE